MAHVHTKLPARTGELRLAQRLASLPDPKLHLWFNVHLPKMNEADLIIWHEEIGVFVVEVKAVPLQHIEYFSHHECILREKSGQERQDKRSPQQQAQEACHGLRDYLGRAKLDEMGRPWISVTACWPMISRRQWNRDLDHEAYRGEFAERMIFSEDLAGGPSAFRDRLRYTRENPPLGKGRRSRFHHEDAHLERFREEISGGARPKPTQSDLQRLRAIEEDVGSATLKEVPPADSMRLVYKGRPGTGKTFRLLKVAYRHALDGRRVLFACYNKVLAADLNRLMSLSEELQRAPVQPRFADIFELLIECANGLAINDLERSDAGEWGELVTEGFIEATEGGWYDTVLVDEAQDMDQWALELLEHLGGPKATLCVATGSAQELYGDSAEWLADFERSAKVKPLRRNFRNTKPVFRLAQLVYEADFTREKLAAASERLGVHKRADQQLLFDRPGGRTPTLRYANDLQLRYFDENQAEFGEIQEQIMTQEYQQIIEEQLDEMDEEREAGRAEDRLQEYPFDLLVLVPGKNRFEYRWASEALRRLVPRVAHIDYVNDDNRRDIPRRDTVRLCTFHSARGIEGTRVVVFGLDKTIDVAKAANAKAANLGYIVLSRAVFELVIAFRMTQAGNPVPSFVEKALSDVGALVDVEDDGANTSAFSDEELHDPYRVGDTVEHEGYGLGVVKMVTASSKLTKMHIDFAGTEYVVPAHSKKLRRVK